MEIALIIAALIGGLIVLVWSADSFIAGSAATANHLNIPTIVIGMIIIGFGTSLPEMLVSGIAAWQGDADLGVGNAIGSNFANITLIFGIAALIIPISVHSRIIKQEMPILLVISFVALVLLLDRKLDVIDAAVLFTMMVVFLGWLGFKTAQKDETGGDEFVIDVAEEIPHDMSLQKALLLVIFGGIFLIISSRIFVWGAVELAELLGVPELIIGLTIVAIGTSLPELAAAVASIRRSEPDLILGNVIGSNMFNTLTVLALPGLIAPGPLNQDILYRDYPLMLMATILLFVFAWFRETKRWQGFVLLAGFISYQIYLYTSSGVI